MPTITADDIVKELTRSCQKSADTKVKEIERAFKQENNRLERENQTLRASVRAYKKGINTVQKKLQQRTRDLK